MALSPTEYQKRLQLLLNLPTIQGITGRIILNDKKALKSEKIDEWRHGQLPDEDIIGLYRNKHYREFKQAINPKARGTVDLILSGKTASTLFPRVGSQKGAFTFGFQDTHNLLGKYGKGILGLNPKWFVNRQKEVYMKQLFIEIKKQYKIA